MGLSREILFAIGIVVMAWSALCLIARLTPTPRDDRILSAIGRFFNLLFKKANFSDGDIEDLKSKAASIALDDLKHKLRDMGKLEEFDGVINTATHKALVIKDNKAAQSMKITADAAIEAGLAQQAEGRIMHTRLGRRLRKKLLKRAGK